MPNENKIEGLGAQPPSAVPDKPSLVPPPADRIPVGDPALESGTVVPSTPPALGSADGQLSPDVQRLVMVPQGQATSHPAEHFTMVAETGDNMPSPNDPTIMYISLRGGGVLEIDRGSGRITKWSRWDLAGNKPVGLSILVTHG